MLKKWHYKSALSYNLACLPRKVHSFSINQPCPHFNNDLANPPSALRHGWIIASPKNDERNYLSILHLGNILFVKRLPGRFKCWTEHNIHIWTVLGSTSNWLSSMSLEQGNLWIGLCEHHLEQNKICWKPVHLTTHKIKITKIHYFQKECSLCRDMHAYSQEVKTKIIVNCNVQMRSSDKPLTCGDQVNSV